MLRNRPDHAELVREQESVINYLNHAITDFLVKVNSMELTEDASQYIGKTFHVVNDLERIGDHALNLTEKTELFADRDLIYSDSAKEEIHQIYQKNLELYDKAMTAFLRQRLSDEEEHALHKLEDSIDALTLRSQDNHIERLRNKECHTEPGIVFAKALHDLERVGDHSYNIGWAAKKDAVSMREI